jgi:hypothetical protein
MAARPTDAQNLAWAALFIVALPLIAIAAPFYILYKLIKLYYDKRVDEQSTLPPRPKNLGLHCDEFAAVIARNLTGSNAPCYSIIRTLLRSCDDFYPSDDPAELKQAADTLTQSFRGLTSSLPPALTQNIQNVSDWEEGQDGLFEVPLVDLIPNVGSVIEEMILPFYSPEIGSTLLFSQLREQLAQNQHRASGVPMSYANRNSHKLIMPSDSDAAPKEIVDKYLYSTPFRDLFYAQVPLDIPIERRFEHTHIIAGTGHGKTQTLQRLLLHDLNSADPPGLVVIDSQGDMIQKIARLRRFQNDDRLIIIDPTDVEFPPALNIFDTSRLERFRPAEREMITNGIIELYEYMFGSLLKAELTQKQNVLFRYTLRLMLYVPNATIVDLVRFLNDPLPYMVHVEKLNDTARDFFHHEFLDKSFTQTRQQIRRRIYGVLENDTFRRMFATPRNMLDMGQALNQGKIVLVNTAKDHLKAENSSLLGRYFIALTLQAALERAGLPEGRRRPAFLYVDEAAEYFDDNIDTLLNTARKFKVGLVMAHQYLDQLTPSLKGSIAANTSVKLAGGVSERDARALAGDMNTDINFLTSRKKQAKRTQFACYVRNLTDQAISISVPFGTLEAEPRMSDEAYGRVIARNRQRLAPPIEEARDPTSDPANPPETRSAKPPPSTPPPGPASAPEGSADWSG